MCVALLQPAYCALPTRAADLAVDRSWWQFFVGCSCCLACIDRCCHSLIAQVKVIHLCDLARARFTCACPEACCLKLTDIKVYVKDSVLQNILSHHLRDTNLVIETFNVKEKICEVQSGISLQST
jgi:hypothetical protein